MWCVIKSEGTCQTKWLTCRLHKVTVDRGILKAKWFQDLHTCLKGQWQEQRNRKVQCSHLPVGLDYHHHQCKSGTDKLAVFKKRQRFCTTTTLYSWRTLVFWASDCGSRNDIAMAKQQRDLSGSLLGSLICSGVTFMITGRDQAHKNIGQKKDEKVPTQTSAKLGGKPIAQSHQQSVATSHGGHHVD